MGTSLGAATAVDFALAYPEAVRKLVLIDGQAWAEGLGPMSSLPRWVAALGVQVSMGAQICTCSSAQAAVHAIWKVYWASNDAWSC